MVDELEHGAPLGNSDHETLIFKFNFNFNFNHDKRILPNVHKYAFLIKGNYNQVNHELSQINWEVNLDHGSVNYLWNCFADKIFKVTDKYIPVCKQGHKIFETPWMDKATLAAVRKKRTMWKKYNHCINPTSKMKYNRAKDLSGKMVKEAKRKYEKYIALEMKQDAKLLWKYVQNKTKVKGNLQCLINQDKVPVIDDKNKAEMLNAFFSSGFIQEDTTRFPKFDIRTDKKLNSVTYNVEWVENKLLKIKETKTPGAGQLHPKFIKETALTLSKPLTIIFNKSIEMAEVPTAWKIANVTVLHKKGSKTDVANYRPISLTSIVGKVMEIRIRDKLLEHMEDNNLFTNQQH